MPQNTANDKTSSQQLDESILTLTKELQDSLKTLTELNKQYEIIRDENGFTITNPIDNAPESEKQKIWNAVKAHEKLILKATILRDRLANQGKGDFLSISCRAIHTLLEKSRKPFEDLQWETTEEEEVENSDKNTYVTRKNFILCECRYDLQELKTLDEQLCDLDKNKNNNKNYQQEHREIVNNYTKIANRYPEFKNNPKQKTPDTLSTFQAAEKQKQAADAKVNQSLKAIHDSAKSLDLPGLITSLGSFIEHKIKLLSVEKKFKAAEKNFHALETSNPEALVRESLIFFKRVNATLIDSSTSNTSTPSVHKKLDSR